MAKEAVRRKCLPRVRGKKSGTIRGSTRHLCARIAVEFSASRWVKKQKYITVLSMCECMCEFSYNGGNNSVWMGGVKKFGEFWLIFRGSELFII